MPFPLDYDSAREAFLAAASRLGCSCEWHPVTARRPAGDLLGIDVARYGAPSAPRVLVISSALHGVEGFFGSALQTAWLNECAKCLNHPTDIAVVLLHGLNPWGLAHVRRADERNVDLNRNFLVPGERYEGSPPLYGLLDPALNPRRPPARVDTFPLHALAALARYGRPAVAQAVAGGQHQFPRGLFYGGREEGETARILRDHLPRWVGNASRVLHLDLHTGLGRWATYRLLTDFPLGLEEAGLRERFGGLVVEPADVPAGYYRSRGGLGSWCRALFTGCQYTLLVAEFGTYSPVKVLAALRRENQAHHYCHPDDPRAVRAKRRLREVFCPESEAWRRTCLTQGVALIRSTIEALEVTGR